MNTNRKFQISVILTLAAILINTIAVGAFPAEGPETTPAAVPCRVVLVNATDVAVEIEIPSRRAEYAALDRIGDCLVLAGESAIAVTGHSEIKADRFLEMKDRQAEQMDKSGNWELPATNDDWMEFKDRQAELMDKSK